MRCLFGMLLLLFFCAGCGGQKAEEGSTPMTSTEMFKHNKAVKSPPPRKPPG